MSKHTWREFERADMYAVAARAEEMEHRELMARMEHIVDGLGDVKGEIVRCRDCVHYEPYRTERHGIMNRCIDEHGHSHKRDENDFCSRGERNGGVQV